MSRSLYEKYAEEAQPAVLAKTISFEDAVESIKGYKGRFSKEYMEWAEEICADMFGRSFEEVRDLVDGKHHWISIAGMYQEGFDKTVEPTRFIRGEVYLPLGYDELSKNNYVLLAVQGKALIEERLNGNLDFYSVSAHYLNRYAGGGIFKFSFSTQKDNDSIYRELSGIFYGLKCSFYCDHNLDSRLADAVDRSGSMKDNDKVQDLEMV